MFSKLIASIKRKFESKPAQRNYHAAQMTHLTSAWATTSRSADSDLRNDLVALRARSRVLAKDNDYMKHFLRMVSSNVVGSTGFTLQMRVKDNNEKPDQLANRAIEKAYKLWSKRKNCDIAGKLGFSAMQRLIIRTVARDGEAIVRKVRGRDVNAFGFALQLLSVDRLDVTLNQQLKNGNVVRMGVEIDSYGRPVAYHLRTDHPGDSVYRSVSGQRYERVPASDIVHLFLQDDPEQTRGLPWAVTAMTRLNHLGAFDEAAVIAARIGASKMGWFKKQDLGSGVPGDQLSGSFMQEASPGEFGVLPDGYDFVGFNPDYPHTNYGPFTKACLRGIASGLGISYNELANDLEGVNYSSLRNGKLSERDEWMVLQNFFSDIFLDDVFEDWLKMSLLMGAVTLPDGSTLPATKFDKFNASEFQGRRWPWVDPVKDIQASVMAINNKLASRTQVHAEMGSDFYDIVEQLASENEILKQFKLDTVAVEKPAKEPPPDDKED